MEKGADWAVMSLCVSVRTGLVCACVCVCVCVHVAA